MDCVTADMLCGDTVSVLPWHRPCFFPPPPSWLCSFIAWPQVMKCPLLLSIMSCHGRTHVGPAASRHGASCYRVSASRALLIVPFSGRNTRGKPSRGKRASRPHALTPSRHRPSSRYSWFISIVRQENRKKSKSKWLRAVKITMVLLFFVLDHPFFFLGKTFYCTLNRKCLVWRTRILTMKTKYISHPLKFN